jgi:hypothetical protein
LLDTYESERRPVGDRVMMHSLSQTALMLPGPEIAALRRLMGELVTQPQSAGYFAHLLAGSDVRYDVGDDHPLSGLLAPELDLGDGRRLAELMRGARPVLLDFAGRTFADAAREAADCIEIHTVLRAGDLKALLVRPDGYVAWATDDTTHDDVARMRAALERWFAVGARI